MGGGAEVLAAATGAGDQAGEVVVAGAGGALLVGAAPGGGDAGGAVVGAVLNKIMDARERDAALFTSVAETPTWEAVLESLTRARELDMIPFSGCRVSLFGADCYLRFNPEWTYDGNDSDQGRDAIRLTLEFTDGTERRTIFWEQAETPTEIVMQVVEVMQSLGCYPGDDMGDYR